MNKSKNAEINQRSTSKEDDNLRPDLPKKIKDPKIQSQDIEQIKQEIEEQEIKAKNNAKSTAENAPDNRKNYLQTYSNSQINNAERVEPKLDIQEVAKTNIKKDDSDENS